MELVFFESTGFFLFFICVYLLRLIYLQFYKSFAFQIISYQMFSVWTLLSPLKPKGCD